MAVAESCTNTSSEAEPIPPGPKRTYLVPVDDSEVRKWGKLVSWLAANGRMQNQRDDSPPVTTRRLFDCSCRPAR